MTKKIPPSRILKSEVFPHFNTSNPAAPYLLETVETIDLDTSTKTYRWIAFPVYDCDVLVIDNSDEGQYMRAFKSTRYSVVRR